MAETIHIDCLSTQYTALSAGHTNVSFKPARIYGGKMIIATSLPAANAANFKTVTSGKEVALGSLGATDNVYWMPNFDETVEVIRG